MSNIFRRQAPEPHSKGKGGRARSISQIKYYDYSTVAVPNGEFLFLISLFNFFFVK
jgi:hypothetical protein